MALKVSETAVLTERQLVSLKHAFKHKFNLDDVVVDIAPVNVLTDAALPPAEGARGAYQAV